MKTGNYCLHALSVIKRNLHILFSSYYGSNRISRWIRQRIEYRHIQELIGLPLAGLAFFGAVVLPQAQAGLSSTELYFDSADSTVQTLVAESRFQWPMRSFCISQYFHSGHKGIDLQNAGGTPVYPVTDGIITHTGNSFFGYGRHVIIIHDKEIQSLYAHLSEILVKNGDMVAKSTQIGEVGATGWATGNHLHLEILLNGVRTNPLEILPEISRQNK